MPANIPGYMPKPSRAWPAPSYCAAAQQVAEANRGALERLLEVIDTQL